MTRPTQHIPDTVDRYLAEDSDLSRLYREHPREDPSPHLAEHVRAAARKALAARAATRQPTRSWFNRIYHAPRIPLATVASGVLVVTISLNVLYEKGDKTLDPGYDGSWQSSNPALSKDAGKPEAPIVQSQNPPPVKPSAERPAPAQTKAQAQAKPAPDFQQKTLPFDLNSQAPFTPEQWLADIQALVKAGKMDEAKEELRGFVQDHPHHPLPDTLKTLLLPVPTSKPTGQTATSPVP